MYLSHSYIQTSKICNDYNGKSRHLVLQVIKYLRQVVVLVFPLRCTTIVTRLLLLLFTLDQEGSNRYE